MANIAILFGGRSGEHEVSCTSAASVLANLASRHSAVLIGIDKNGSWYRQDRPAGAPRILEIITDKSKRLSVRPAGGILNARGEKIDIDVVIPVLHGSFGEDGTVQGLLEIARVAYAGSGVLGSAIGMDKDFSKRIWLQHGLPVVPWRALYAGVDNPESPDLAAALFKELGSALFVKPANAGSSVGVSLVKSPADLVRALKTGWKYDRKLLVEKAVNGREIECSVMGYTHPEAFPPGEVIPSGGHEFYDYDAKYTDPDGALLKVPAVMTEQEAAAVRDLAVRAYRTVGAGGLARVDFLMDKITGELFINEINTMPGMTSISLFPRMTAAGGLDFTGMIDRLIKGALEEFAFREGLSYSH